jgi:calcium-dependent protein kinase
MWYACYDDESEEETAFEIQKQCTPNCLQEDKIQNKDDSFAGSETQTQTSTECDSDKAEDSESKSSDVSSATSDVSSSDHRMATSDVARAPDSPWYSFRETDSENGAARQPASHADSNGYPKPSVPPEMNLPALQEECSEFSPGLARRCVARRPLAEDYDVDGRVLGRGCLGGAVRLGRHRASGYSVAVKTLQQRTDPLWRRLVQSEVEINLSLEPHPHIVRLLEALEDVDRAGTDRLHGRVHLILEHCSGGDLYDYVLENGHCSEKRSRELAQQMIRAIRFLHDRDIVHRDVSMGNWLFVSPAEGVPIKLADFGLAQKVGASIAAEEVGTPFFIAPEVLEGSSVGLSCDMWSLGVCIHVVLCGMPPFETPEGALTFGAVPTFQGPTWDRVSPDCRVLVKSLLARNPKDRLTAAQALENPWFNPEQDKLNVVLDKPLLAKVRCSAAAGPMWRAAAAFVARQVPFDTPAGITSIQIFNALDTRGCGKITVEALSQILTNAPGMDECEAKMVAAALADSDGEIEYLSFIAAVRGLTCGPELGHLFRAFDDISNNEADNSKNGVTVVSVTDVARTLGDNAITGPAGCALRSRPAAGEAKFAAALSLEEPSCITCNCRRSSSKSAAVAAADSKRSCLARPAKRTNSGIIVELPNGSAQGLPFAGGRVSMGASWALSSQQVATAMYPIGGSSDNVMKLCNDSVDPDVCDGVFRRRYSAWRRHCVRVG